MSDKPYGDLAHSETRDDSGPKFLAKFPVLGMPATTLEIAFAHALQQIERTFSPAQGFDDAALGRIVRAMMPASRTILRIGMELRADLFKHQHEYYRELDHR